MGRQVSLLLTNTDLQILDDVLRRPGDTEIYFDMESERRDGLIPAPTLVMDEREVGLVSLMCVLSPATSTWTLVVENHSPTKRRVDVAKSDVIDLWRPYCKDGVIRRGRLWFEPRPYVDGDLVDKSIEVVRWADRVLNRVRRGFAYDKPRFSYVGPDAARRISSGELKVVN